jgi:hypothetical protein
MIAAAASPDLWHVGKLPGDAGRIIRDENGLRVAEHSDPRAARRLVRHNNRRASHRFLTEAPPPA